MSRTFVWCRKVKHLSVFLESLSLSSSSGIICAGLSIYTASAFYSTRTHQGFIILLDTIVWRSNTCFLNSLSRYNSLCHLIQVYLLFFYFSLNLKSRLVLSRPQDFTLTVTYYSKTWYKILEVWYVPFAVPCSSIVQVSHWIRKGHSSTSLYTRQCCSSLLEVNKIEARL